MQPITPPDSAISSGIHRKWKVLAIVGTGTYMSALDSSIVNIALPTIQQKTGSALSTAEWVVLAYLVTLSATMLLFGRLGDIFGNRRIFILGACIFGVGSGLCGLSGTIEHLIVFRIIQAIGGAMLMALGPAILTSAFAERERGKALGLQATMTYVGLTTGPVLGGFLTQHYGWSSIFFINVPIVAVMVVAAVSVLEKDRLRTAQKLDPVGSITIASGMASLLLALSIGSESGWGRPMVWTLAAISVVSFITFITTELRVSHPVLNLGLFKNRTFAASVAAAYLNYVAAAAVNFLLPFFLIQAKNMPESKAGMLMMTAPVMMVLLTGFSGHLSDRIGVRLPATVGMTLMVVGLLLLRGLSADSTYSHIVYVLAVFGIGAGLFTSPNNSAIMGSAPKAAKGVAGAIMSSARTVGFASGVALAGAIYVSKLHSLSHMPTQQAVASAMSLSILVVAAIATVGIVLSATRGETSIGQT